MNLLKNVDGSGNGLTNLLSKLADSAGWISNKETPKKVAIDTYIKDIQESDYDSVLKAALISNAKRLLKNTVIKTILYILHFKIYKKVLILKKLKTTG